LIEINLQGFRNLEGFVISPLMAITHCNLFASPHIPPLIPKLAKELQFAPAPYL